MSIKQLCNRKVRILLWLYGPEKFPGLSRNGPLVLISIYVFAIFFFVFSSVLVSTEKMYPALKTALYHISKQRSLSKIPLFNSLFGVWKCGHTRSFEFDVSHQCH